MVVGFVYADDERPGPFADVAAGARVSVPEPGPPWIVVGHRLDRVLVARWPGRLFRVAEVPGSRRSAPNQNLRADAGYTRVLAVDVLAELPAWRLFGPHGEAVAEVLEFARGLTLPIAREVAGSSDHNAAGADGPLGLQAAVLADLVTGRARLFGGVDADGELVGPWAAAYSLLAARVVRARNGGR